MKTSAKTSIKEVETAVSSPFLLVKSGDEGEGDAIAVFSLSIAGGAPSPTS